MKTRIIVVLGVALVAGGISIRADTPEQAAARAALEQKMEELDHTPTSPPTDAKSVAAMAKPAESASNPTDTTSVAATAPSTVPAETIPATEGPATVAPVAAAPASKTPADADFPQTIPAADTSAQTAALTALQQKMNELDQSAARPSPDTNSMAAAAKPAESSTGPTSPVVTHAVTSPAAPVSEAAAAVNASVQAAALAAVQQKMREMDQPQAQPVTETPTAQAPVAVSPGIAPAAAAPPSAAPAVATPAPEVSAAPAAVAVAPAVSAEPVAMPTDTQPAAVPATPGPAPAVPAAMILPYSSPGQARPVNQLVTASGVIYKDVEVESVKDDGIMISYTAANGSWAMAKVHFEDLPPDIRQQYGK